jgi:hypothetical protein
MWISNSRKLRRIVSLSAADSPQNLRKGKGAFMWVWAVCAADCLEDRLRIQRGVFHAFHVDCSLDCRRSDPTVDRSTGSIDEPFRELRAMARGELCRNCRGLGWARARIEQDRALFHFPSGGLPAERHPQHRVWRSATPALYLFPGSGLGGLLAKTC